MAGYIGSKASVVSNGAERKKVFDITTTTTSLTGLAYTLGQVHVFHNGVRLVDGTDYTATTGSGITLTVAAESGDQVAVVSYATFQPADTYAKAEVYTKTEANALYIAAGTPLGGGLYKGENGTTGSSAGDIFRINKQTLDTNVTIDADENASCAGPLTLGTNVVLTVTGNLTVV